MDQPGKVANPARGQLNRENIPLSPCVPENLVSRDGFSRPVPRQVSLMMPPWEDQCEWHRMTRMTGPDCVVMCNLINTPTHPHTYNG